VHYLISNRHIIPCKVENVFTAVEKMKFNICIIQFFLKQSDYGHQNRSKVWENIAADDNLDKVLNCAEMEPSG